MAVMMVLTVLSFRPYKLQLVQVLTENNKLRKQFCEFVIHELDNGEPFVPQDYVQWLSDISHERLSELPQCVHLGNVIIPLTYHLHLWRGWHWTFIAVLKLNFQILFWISNEQHGALLCFNNPAKLGYSLTFTLYLIWRTLLPPTSEKPFVLIC